MTVTPITEARLLTVADLADFAQLGPATIRQEIHEGRLDAFRFGNEYRIRPEDVDPWLQTRRVACTRVGQAVSLPRDPNAEKTTFREVARQMAGLRRETAGKDLRHEDAS